MLLIYYFLGFPDCIPVVYINRFLCTFCKLIVKILRLIRFRSNLFGEMGGDMFLFQEADELSFCDVN